MKLWSLFCIWIVLMQIGAALSSINKVVCADSTASQLIQCGEDFVIDIQNVTIGILPGCRSIPEMQRFGQFYALNPPCVRSLRQDGEGVYRRCHGEKACTLDGSVVPVEHLTSQTDVCGWTTSTALSFRYLCQNVRIGQPDDDIEYHGTVLKIFSPCFPSYTPKPKAGRYEVDCTITPDRTIQYTTTQFKITSKLVKMYPGRMYCRDYLFFNRGSSPNPEHNFKFGRHYCGRNDGVQVEVWNDDVISIDTIHDVHITYRAFSEGAGSKYWIIVTATYNETPVHLTATCKTTTFLSPDLVCPAPPTTVRPPPITTTTATTTISSAITSLAAFLATESTSTNGSTRSNTLFPELGEEALGDGEGAGESISKENGSTGLVIGLAIAVVIIVLLAVFAAILTWKLRKKRDNENKTSINSNETNASSQDLNTNHQDTYEIIPDHLVNRESGHGLPNPVLSTTPVTTVADPSAYEEVQQASEESKAAEETTGQPTGDYEDISLKDKPYESLKRAVYENAAETPELKIYAGLDQSKRQSTA